MANWLKSVIFLALFAASALAHQTGVHKRLEMTVTRTTIKGRW
jgi:hypothetical protein